MILGHTPLSVSVYVNDPVLSPQLSLALPPPVTKSPYVTKAKGTSTLHSNTRSAGQMITGGVISSIVIVCTHWLMFPQESAIEYVLVMILGHTPLSASV